MRQFQNAGLEMMHEHVQFEDGGRSLEVGLMEMLKRKLRKG
jgi:hypothetical protein